MPLFLVRHGDTRYSGTYCGSTNPPLTRRGRDQGSIAAGILSKFQIDICYSSPMLRAQQTALILQRRLKIPLITRASLKEIDFGLWEGLRFQEIETKWPIMAEHWLKDPMTVRIPSAETFACLRGRIKRLLGRIRCQISSGQILIVAHGGPLAAIVLELLCLPDREFPKYIQPTGSIRMIHGCHIQSLC
jgi:broad specificity phosphatase PhoE